MLEMELSACDAGSIRMFTQADSRSMGQKKSINLDTILKDKS
jgi:hypothetical protein